MPRLLVSLRPDDRDVGGGCQLLVEFPAFREFAGPVVDGSGNSSLVVPVPNRPGLEGRRVYAQWIIPDPNGLAFAVGRNWAASGGLEIYLSSNTL